LEQAVRKVLIALTGKGYEAYIVGGAVRDLLLHQVPHDYDITTSAHPEEIRAVADEQGWRVVDIQGAQFGIIAILVDSVVVETATFRGESYGTDSHRPEKIWYATTLQEDVSRRDFTVNALAMDVSGTIYDYVGGCKDIRKKRLAAVGDPVRRFQEDALRLFRVCRFTGQLDFLPTKDVLAAMPRAFSRVEGLSLARVVAEIDKLMVTPYVAKGLDVLVRSGLGDCCCRKKKSGVYTLVPILPELAHLPHTPQSRPFHAFDAWFHTLAAVAHTPPELTVRYAALFHDVAKGLPGIRGVHQGRLTDYGHDEKGAAIAAQILTRWEKPEAWVCRVAWLVKTHMKFHYFANTGMGDVDKWLRKEAQQGPFHRTGDLTEAVGQATQLAIGDVLACSGSSDTNGTASFGEYMQLLAGQMPVHTKDLHYDRRIPEQCGILTGACLQVLLQRVQNKNLKNDPEILAKAAGKWLQRQRGAYDNDDESKQ
jgi:tRNA nucleotidyltransferase/poly(A) polymerase